LESVIGKRGDRGFWRKEEGMLGPNVLQIGMKEDREEGGDLGNGRGMGAGGKVRDCRMSR